MIRLVSKIKSLLAPLFMRLALIMNSPAFAAQVMAWVSWRVGKGETKVLCLGRTIFVDDVKAMVKYSGQIEYIVVHLQHFENILSYYVRGEERKRIIEANYLTTDAGREGRARYREFLIRLLPRLRARLGIQAVLSGHLSYVVQQEIINAAAAGKLPFIVLHKEALDVYGGLLETYRNYAFAGAKVLFYNERARDELVKRVGGLAWEKTAVVGIPRFDVYFQNQRVPKPKHISFFCFFPQDKFLTLIRDPQKLARAKQAYAEFHRLVMDFASRHSDFHVTTKTKSAQHYLDYVLDIYQASYPKGLPNLTITNFAKTTDLIFDSEVIVGFDSTVLIEAVAAGRTIVRPDFREYAADDSWDFLAGFESLVNYVKTYEDLEKFLLRGRPNKTQQQAREAFLKHLVGVSDGRASSRAENEIIETIRNYR